LRNGSVLFQLGSVCRSDFHFDDPLIEPQEPTSTCLQGASWTFGNAKSTSQLNGFSRQPALALLLLAIKPVAVEHCTRTPG
jgi:hypothetical protein